MKRAYVLIAIVGAALAVTPAMPQRSHMKTPPAPNMEKILPKNGLNRQDKKFTSEAAMINMAEVMLGHLATERGGSWGKRFGADMEREHSGALSELRAVAQKKGLNLPSEPDSKSKALYAHLSRLHGSAFDNAYRAAMVAGHGEATGKFSTEIQRGRDSMVRNYAVMTLPAVRMHLKLAKERKTIERQ